MKILLILLLIYLSIEFLIYIFFPKLLKSNQFDESSVIIKDETLGWRQKPHLSFKYYHRYNKNMFAKCKFNNFGILDNVNYYNKKNKKKRIAIFGDAFESTDKSEDFPAFGRPTNPISAINFNLNHTQRSSPVLPDVNFLGA